MSTDSKGKSLKKIIDILNDKGIVLKTVDEIDLSTLKTRKKLRLFSGVLENEYYISIFIVNQKSRFLKKNAIEIIALEKKLEESENHKYKNKLLMISSPLCSKANSFLEEDGWRVFEVKNDTL